MAVTAKDKHGTFTKARRTDGPALDRRTARWFAIVRGSWSKGYATRREAEAAERSMQTRADAGAMPAASSMTLGEFIDTVWLPYIDAKVARGVLKKGPAQSYRIQWEAYAKPALAGVRLRDLKPEHLRRLYTELATRSS